LNNLPGPDDSTAPIFRSFFMGGFECSTHRIVGGRRLDLVASTGHDRLAFEDYARLRAAGLQVAREGIRWHLIEPRRGELDFRTVQPIVRAAKAHGVQVLFDLCHYGWPDWLDIWSPDFVSSFARLARAFVRWLRAQWDDVPFITPVNEISFFSWAAAEVGYFHPYEKHRGGELKRQLVRASLAAIDAIWEEEPAARIVHTDPVINVIAHPSRPQDRKAAEAYRCAQFEAVDMLAGRVQPELGGHPRYVDVLGLNYYHDNQWLYRSGRKIPRDHPLYRPLRMLLREWAERYRRPLLLAETGIEGPARPAWLRWVADEIAAARAEGQPIHGICLYPIVNHPGWTNDRHCHNGLWDYPDEAGGRQTHEPLAKELRRQIKRFAGAGKPQSSPTSSSSSGVSGGGDDTSAA
jgi:beta-glucosidase/6-phospho-beta-glucosidase/beta-galactosidase